MKGILGTTAIIIAALTAAPASAGTLFKCQGADGVTSYVSKRLAGARCSAISYSRDLRPAPRPVVSARSNHSRRVGSGSSTGVQ